MRMGGSARQLREEFEAQFEPHGGGQYLYRRNRRGEPIPVSSEERERFIGQYARRIRCILGGMMAALFASAAAFIWWTVANHREIQDSAIYLGIGAITVVAIALMYWVRGAPARELEGRGSVGRERTRDEMRAIFFAKISYGQLALAALFGVFLLVHRTADADILSGWNRIWLVLGVGLVALAAVQAFRKWLFENS